MLFSVAGDGVDYEYHGRPQLWHRIDALFHECLRLSSHFKVAGKQATTAVSVAVLVHYLDQGQHLV